MFPDCAITKSFKQKANKVRHAIWNRTLLSKDQMLKELMALLFTFQFGKTATSQIKKHSYATCNSNDLGRIVTAYIEILFLGKYRAEDLLRHLHEMLGMLKPICFQCTLPLPSENIRKPYSFWMFSGVRERVHWEQAGKCKEAVNFKPLYGWAQCQFIIQALSM